MKKIPFYFSIDFEDFYYDSLRALNIQHPKSKEDALIKSYERIKDICKNYLSNKKITFFVTGVIIITTTIYIKVTEKNLPITLI